MIHTIFSNELWVRAVYEIRVAMNWPPFEVSCGTWVFIIPLYICVWNFINKKVLPWLSVVVHSCITSTELDWGKIIMNQDQPGL